MASRRAHRSDVRLVNVVDKICMAKLRAFLKAMLKQYDGARIQMATQFRITMPARQPAERTNCDSPRYSADSRYI